MTALPFNDRQLRVERRPSWTSHIGQKQTLAKMLKSGHLML